MTGARKKQLKALARLMNRQNEIPIPVTDPLIECFDWVITDEEADFMIRMGTSPRTRAELAAASGLPPGESDALVDTLCRKGVVWSRKEPGREEGFVLASILVGWFELQLARARNTPEEAEFARRLDALFASWKDFNLLPLRPAMNLFMRLFSKPFQSIAPVAGRGGKKRTRKIEVERSLSPSSGDVRTADNVRALIESAGDGEPIGVMHCFCRQWRKLVDEPCAFDVPLEACIVMGEFGRHVIEYGFGRAISRNEALEIIENCRKAGAVHTIFHERDDAGLAEIAVCNCCWDCCGVLGSHNRGILPLHFACRAKAVLDPEACIGCGICEKFCPTAAIRVKDKKATLDASRCIGCGQCADRCKTGSLTLTQEKRNVFLPLQKPGQVRIPG